MPGVPHMSAQEVERADALQKVGKTPLDITNALQASRTKQGMPGPSKHVVHRFVKGETFVRGRSESRGRPGRLPPRLLQTVNAQRARLAREERQKPDGPQLVTWGDIHKATKQALKATGALKGDVENVSFVLRERTPGRLRSSSDART